MTNRQPTTIPRLIRIGIARLRPLPDAIEVRHAWSNEDCSWHGSSFELASGLEVIEHCGAPSTVFANTMPDFHPPRA
jgi:hypothetical protein